MRCFEMIVNKIRRHNFQIAVERIRMLGLETSQEAKVVRAKL
jgi:hypothetical protein